MTGFDETVPPEPDPSADATSADDARDNVVPPEGGPEEFDAHDGTAARTDGDPDAESGHPGD